MSELNVRVGKWLWFVSLMSPFFLVYIVSRFAIVSPVWAFGNFPIFGSPTIPQDSSWFLTFFFFMIFQEGNDIYYQIQFTPMITFCILFLPHILSMWGLELTAESTKTGWRDLLVFLPILTFIVLTLPLFLSFFSGNFQNFQIPIPIAWICQISKYSQIYIKRRNLSQLHLDSDSEVINLKDVKPTPKITFECSTRVNENRIIYGVMISNESNQTVTDIHYSIISYPIESLSIDGAEKFFKEKLLSKESIDHTFEFQPTKDCVSGDIVGVLSFIDAEGVPHSITSTPCSVLVVCDLLTPLIIKSEDFEQIINEMDSGEITLRVTDWTPEEMTKKSLEVLKNSNFAEIANQSSDAGDYSETRISGSGIGKYTKKSIALVLTITGVPAEKGTTCQIRVASEDKAMLVSALDEIYQKLAAWRCSVCGVGLSLQNVDKLKAGVSISCETCGAVIDN